MEFKQLIQERRSVRKYAAGKTLDRQTLETILTQARMAASWKNSQTARTYVAFSPEAVAKVRECLPAFNQTSTENACAYVVTTYVRDVAAFSQGQAVDELGNKWGAYDLGLHDSYLLLAARDAGLDTLIMGMRDAGALRAFFSIPEYEDIMSVISLGYRDGEPALRPRKALSEISVIK